MYGRFWKNIVFTPLFFATVLISAMLLVSNVPFEMVHNYLTMEITNISFYLNSILNSELHENMPYVVLPVAVGIPYMNFLYGEISEKRYRDSLLRSGRDRYVSRHIFQAAFSGVVIVGIAVLLSLAFSAALIIENGFKIEIDNTSQFSGYYLPFYSGLEEKGMGWFYYAAKLMMLLCYGAIWPVIGAVAIFWTENRYVAAAVPFMVSAILEAGADRFSFEWIRPSNFLAMDWMLSKAYGGIPYMAAVLLSICGVCWILVRIRLDKQNMGTSI